MAATDALILQALVAVGMSQERLKFLANAEASDRPPAASRRAPPEASGPPRSRSGARRRLGSAGAAELSDPVDSLEVGEHEDLEELGASRRRRR
jgi:hypothetical protein